MTRPHETLRVEDARWREAQAFERGYWARGNRRNGLLKLAKRLVLALRRPREFAYILRFRDFYCGDDWNFWWYEAFDGYRMLPRRVDRALEVGCGPHSNLRVLARVISIGEMTLADPLMEDYLGYRMAWVAEQARRGAIRTSTCMGESLPFEDGAFDLVVCVNVLDHVQDMPRCLDEMRRVLAPGGHLVLGQELTGATDFERDDVQSDVGHPIKIEHGTLDAELGDGWDRVFHRVLERDRGRNPEAHYGTYLLVARRC